MLRALGGRSVVRMHDMGMVHSDIKTQNFFVKSDGRIFLGDYSLAHVRKK